MLNWIFCIQKFLGGNTTCWPYGFTNGKKWAQHKLMGPDSTFDVDTLFMFYKRRPIRNGKQIFKKIRDRAQPFQKI